MGNSAIQVCIFIKSIQKTRTGYSGDRFELQKRLRKDFTRKNPGENGEGKNFVPSQFSLLSTDMN